MFIDNVTMFAKVYSTQNSQSASLNEKSTWFREENWRLRHRQFFLIV